MFCAKLDLFSTRFRMLFWKHFRGSLIPITIGCASGSRTIWKTDIFPFANLVVDMCSFYIRLTYLLVGNGLNSFFFLYRSTSAAESVKSITFSETYFCLNKDDLLLAKLDSVNQSANY